MGGLLNTLEIASSSLLASRAGIETAGVNISNVNNPGYARQRVIVEPRRDPTGAGAGVEVVGVKSLRDSILDEQLIRESSNKAYLDGLMQISDQMGGWIEAAQADGSLSASVPPLVVLYTLYARACDPVPGFLKAGGQHSDEEIVDLVLATCFDGLNTR